MRIQLNLSSSVRAALCLCAGLLTLVCGPSASAALVMWNLNPANLNAPVGSSSNSYISSGVSITAYGYDHPTSGPDTAHELYFKSEGGDEHGLGLVGTLNNELTITGSHPDNYIQFDLNNVLLGGFTNGKIQVASITQTEKFNIYGSNTLGTLGTKISAISGGYDASFDDVFVNIPNFGTYQFISIVSGSGNLLPFAIEANPVPEIGGTTAAFALLAFFGVVMASRAIRTRYTS
jgi:hypothetical protein